ncbi:hypothetical protein EXIGLDRAFT_701818 [Exidia glandulosa HHB12029]|uniref:Uncharacterized protein n=1 Tax=Exidia glandulosa HHB12029 TaxID=1314781 RepID=A0A165CVC0_EXIGL|nr:hypothetical protein EXIGLDRAFT_701818 [Exidia glandulosa HHB12029]
MASRKGEANTNSSEARPRVSRRKQGAEPEVSNIDFTGKVGTLKDKPAAKGKPAAKARNSVSSAGGRRGARKRGQVGANHESSVDPMEDDDDEPPPVPSSRTSTRNLRGRSTSNPVEQEPLNAGESQAEASDDGEERPVVKPKAKAPSMKPSVVSSNPQPLSSDDDDDDADRSANEAAGRKRKPVLDIETPKVNAPSFGTPRFSRFTEEEAYEIGSSAPHAKRTRDNRSGKSRGRDSSDPEDSMSEARDRKKSKTTNSKAQRSTQKRTAAQLSDDEQLPAPSKPSKAPRINAKQAKDFRTEATAGLQEVMRRRTQAFRTQLKSPLNIDFSAEAAPSQAVPKPVPNDEERMEEGKTSDGGDKGEAKATREKRKKKGKKTDGGDKGEGKTSDEKHKKKGKKSDGGDKGKDEKSVEQPKKKGSKSGGGDKGKDKKNVEQPEKKGSKSDGGEKGKGKTSDGGDGEKPTFKRADNFKGAGVRAENKIWTGMRKYGAVRNLFHARDTEIKAKSETKSKKHLDHFDAVVRKGYAMNLKHSSYVLVVAMPLADPESGGVQGQAYAWGSEPLMRDMPGILGDTAHKLVTGTVAKRAQGYENVEKDVRRAMKEKDRTIAAYEASLGKLSPEEKKKALETLAKARRKSQPKGRMRNVPADPDVDINLGAGSSTNAVMWKLVHEDALAGYEGDGEENEEERKTDESDEEDEEEEEPKTDGDEDKEETPVNGGGSSSSSSGSSSDSDSSDSSDA